MCCNTVIALIQFKVDCFIVMVLQCYSAIAVSFFKALWFYSSMVRKWYLCKMTENGASVGRPGRAGKGKVICHFRLHSFPKDQSKVR